VDQGTVSQHARPQTPRICGERQPFPGLMRQSSRPRWGRSWIACRLSEERKLSSVHPCLPFHRFPPSFERSQTTRTLDFALDLWYYLCRGSAEALLARRAAVFQLIRQSCVTSNHTVLNRAPEVIQLHSELLAAVDRLTREFPYVDSSRSRRECHREIPIPFSGAIRRTMLRYSFVPSSRARRSGSRASSHGALRL